MIIRTLLIFFIGITLSGVLLAETPDSLKTPKKALIYSLVLPGSGQLYNEKYLKASIVLSGISYLGFQAYSFDESFKDSEDLEDRDNRNKYLWWTAGAWLLSAFDAYVDAHLSGFPVDDIEVIPSGKSISLEFVKYF